MLPNQFSSEVNHRIAQAVASGLNNAGDRALIDIIQHVAVRTGRLRDSYGVTRRATPENLQAEVGSPISYREEQYPYQNNPRGGSDPPLLANGGMNDVVRDEVRKAIAKEFS